MVERKRLGDMLVEGGLISSSQLQSALQHQQNSAGKKLGDILVDNGVVTEEEVLRVLQKSLHINYITLAEIKIPDNVISLLPHEIAVKYNVIPYRLTSNELYLATADPLDYDMLSIIETTTGKRVTPCLATRADIANSIARHYDRKLIVNAADTLNATSSMADEVEALEQSESDSAESRLGNVPIVRFINNLIIQAHSSGTSDIHIEPTSQDVRIRFRVDGLLSEIVRMNSRTLPAIITRVKIMSGMDIAEKRIPLDGRFSLDINEQELSARVASMPTVFGEKIVIRLLADSRLGVLKLEDLGFTKEDAKVLRKAISLPNGLVLITGPTGSGKTTTLYSLLSELAHVSTNVLTVEDPVEKYVEGINQTQVNNRAGLTFANGLRALLRQDPDKIMIGEIRDTETADIAARAAITGHLVLASMHTNSAASAFMRIVDMGVEPYVAASSIVTTVAQRLVSTLCPYCKTEYTPHDAERAFLDRYNVNQEVLYDSPGCTRCDGLGHIGRRAVCEIIVTDATIRNMIVSRKNTSDITSYLRETKNQNFFIDEAIELAVKGIISVREAMVLSDVIE